MQVWKNATIEDAVYDYITCGVVPLLDRINIISILGADYNDLFRAIRALSCVHVVVTGILQPAIPIM